MTKLKTKKNRKQKPKKKSSKKVSISDLDSSQVFADVCQRVSAELADWIPLEAYLWGTGEAQKTHGMNWVKVLSGQKKTFKIKELPSVEEHYEHPEMAASLDLLHSILAVARVADHTQKDLFANFLDQLNRSLDLGGDRMLSSDPVCWQLLFGEIPMVLGCLFPQFHESSNWIATGRASCSGVLEETLDSNGIPNSAYLSQAGFLLASWTRCLLLGQRKQQEWFDTDTQTQYEYFVRQVMALLRKDGSLALSEQGVNLRPVIQAALTCYEDEEDSNIAKCIFPKKPARSLKKSASATQKSRLPNLNALPESSSISEWAEVAIMQTEWLPGSPKLIVDFRQRKIQAELLVGGCIMGQEMRHQILCDDQPSRPVTDWEVVCWHSDQDGDFLELECELDNGGTWQKHFLLARDELFLLVGDVLLNAPCSELRLESQWTMGQDAGFGVTRENREIFLTREAKTVASILPVSLPEWRQEKNESDLSVLESELVFHQTGSGGSLYAPLFFDLDAKRCRKPLTWRQLTVAEQLETVPRHRAVAYRIQAGGQQWLAYRSLAAPANRTFLGQNLSVEFFVGTLESDGTCSEIISID